MEAGGNARGLQQKGEGAQSRERAELPPPPPQRSGSGSRIASSLQPFSCFYFEGVCAEINELPL